METETYPPITQAKNVSKKLKPAEGPAIGVNINFHVLKSANEAYTHITIITYLRMLNRQHHLFQEQYTTEQLMHDQ